MIKGLSELANSIKEKELKQVEEYLNHIFHPVTRGDMFEGLTQNIIKSTVGQVPEIHICEGFVKNYRNKMLSPQMDIIIYINECEKIPHTNSKIVSIDNVLAIIEIKKTLSKTELQDFYDKQGKIYDLLDDKMRFDEELFSLSTKALFRKIINDEKAKESLSKLEYYLYHVMKVENSSPLRICFGYDGFIKETTLRDNLLYVIKDRIENQLPHTGMPSLPSLVICENNCLIKMIAQPFIKPSTDPHIIMSSYKGDVIRVLLTMLIAKIESKTDVRFELDSDDYQVLKFNDFLGVDIDDDDNTRYYPCTLTHQESKNNMNKTIDWEPIEISEFENLVVTLLCNLSYEKEPQLSVDSEIFKEHDLDKELINLIRFGFISIHDNIVELISTECLVVIFEGKFLIGENNANQMKNWMRNKIKEHKSK